MGLFRSRNVFRDLAERNRGRMGLVIVVAVAVGIATTNSWIAVAAIAVGAPLAYAGSCWLLPWARCVMCKGSGRKTRKDGKVWRECRWCKGAGRRRRIGRVVHSHVTRIRKKAS